jgi:hypothetical protein
MYTLQSRKVESRRGLALMKFGGSRLLDLIFTAVQYTLVSMALNSCGV